MIADRFQQSPECRIAPAGTGIGGFDRGAEAGDHLLGLDCPVAGHIELHEGTAEGLFTGMLLHQTAQGSFIPVIRFSC